MKAHRRSSVLPRCLAISLLAPLLVTQPAAAQGSGTGMERMLQEKGCTACHEITEPALGPPLVAVARRHRERRDVMVEVLAQKIRHGGAGNWGAFPMVANELIVSPEEARAMARWILDLDRTR